MLTVSFVENKGGQVPSVSRLRHYWYMWHLSVKAQFLFEISAEVYVRGIRSTSERFDRPECQALGNGIPYQMAGIL